MFNEYYDTRIMNWLPELMLGLLILLVGFIVAKVVENAVYRLLKKNRVDERFGAKTASPSEQPEKKRTHIADIISKVVFFIILFFAVVLFFNIMDLDMVASPFVSMYSSLSGAIIGILKAALILVLAWVLATVVKKLILMAGKKLNLNRFLTKTGTSPADVNKAKWFETLANIAFYLILLLFLPAVLNALGLSGVSGPFEDMLTAFLNFIPKLVGAVLVFVIGWFAAKIVREILTKFLQSIGTDRLVEKFNLEGMFKGTSLSKVIGLIAFIFILIPVTISALEVLDLNGISEPAIDMLNKVLAMIPNIIVAILLVLAGIAVAKWVKGIVVLFLENLGIDSLFGKMGVKQTDEDGTPFSFAQIIGTIVQIIVILLFVSEALQVMKLEFMMNIAGAIFAYLPMVIAAVVILAVGFWLANLAEKFVGAVMKDPSGSPHVLRYVAKYAILAFAFFMALSQLGIAPMIINVAFMLILGGLALAFGLAFGLGGKDHASRYLSKMEKSLTSSNVSKSAWEQKKYEEKLKEKDFEQRAQQAAEKVEETMDKQNTNRPNTNGPEKSDPDFNPMNPAGTVRKDANPRTDEASDSHLYGTSAHSDELPLTDPGEGNVGEFRENANERFTDKRDSNTSAFDETENRDDNQ
ncbi:mechanosensitive ion channel [Chungangia koreensis]|uniref:Mechanosensitive ion channel n=1 Tax=Chungangia koreensis TaxID=752657 RepID=A0ABV8X4V8_9LACT